MALSRAASKKRKAVTHDSPEADEVLLSDGGPDEFEAGLLDGTLSQSEDDSEGEEEDLRSIGGDSKDDEVESSEEGIGSDEIPSEDEATSQYGGKTNGSGSAQRTSFRSSPFLNQPSQKANLLSRE